VSPRFAAAASAWRWPRRRATVLNNSPARVSPLSRFAGLRQGYRVDGRWELCVAGGAVWQSSRQRCVWQSRRQRYVSGGEATFGLAMDRPLRAEMRRYCLTPNARSLAGSGCSLRDPCRSAIRPIEGVQGHAPVCPLNVDFVEEPPVLAPAFGICGDVSEADFLVLRLMWRRWALEGG
jgi:hypothetical protein